MEQIKGKILAVNISEEKGVIKTPRDKIVLNEKGIAGDAHAGTWHRQISLLGIESVEKFSLEAGRKINHGEFAENITTSGIDILKTAVLDRFYVGEVEMEVTQLGKKCHGDNCAIYREVGNCVMPKEGIFCHVIKGGTIKPDDEIIWEKRPLKIKVVTLSDRAYNNEYEDLSGKTTLNILKEFFKDKRWHSEFEYLLIPDDETMLTKELKSDYDILFTLGGTGIGPRDITPDVIMKMADKNISGIMENIRLKYGEKNPKALISRSVAVMIEKKFVYALPGSVKAVGEYLSEIFKTMEHLIIMAHGIDNH